MSPPSPSPLRWMLVASALLALLGLAVAYHPVQPGLRAQFYRGPEPNGDAAVSIIQPGVSTEGVLDAWQQAPPATFSAAWTGALLVLRTGRYTFRTISDDGSWLYIDGARVIDNGGQHGAQPAAVTLALDRGVHTVRLEYTQLAGAMHVQWNWAPEGAPLHAVDPWRLSPRKADVWLAASSAAAQVSYAWAKWIWLALAVLSCAVLVGRRIAAAVPWLRAAGVWPALPVIIIGSLVLNAVALWWGLPGGYWPPDELTPKDVAVALAQRFSHGWFERYPPFHFYVLAAVNFPVWLMEQAGMVTPGGMPGETLRAVLGRGVSLAAGAGTLWLLCLCGLRLVGRRATIFALLQFALTAPFVYYAKTGNLDVPYLFWFALAFWFLLRLLDDLRLADFIGYGVAATLSIGTKDQAYGLFALPSLLILHRLWQAYRGEGRPLPWLRALVDRRLLAGAGIAVVLFALVHNFAFNWRGFVAHVDIILGGASQGYRMFPRTPAGEWDLLALTLRIVQRALGWPMLVTFTAGLVVAWARPQTRRAALLITLPAASYYLTFIAVVGYNYDRFLLPVFFVLSMGAGLALDWWLSFGWSRALHRTLAWAVLAYSFVYVAQIDALMLRDSRYTLERYFAQVDRSGDAVGYVFPTLYNPRLDGLPNSEITSVEQLQWEQPRWFVLNVEYGRTEPSTSHIGQLVSGLQDGRLGYRPVYRERTPAPFPWLPWPHRDLTGDRLDGPTEITSSLRHINPTFIVYERQ